MMFVELVFEDRWKRFDEALQILNLLWEQENENDELDYNGHCYKFKKVVVAPRPFQKPHPPILIGSWGSSDASLRRVAKYGDGWMASAYNITPDKFKEKCKTLLDYRKDMGKDTTTFDKSLVSMLGYIDNKKKKHTRWQKMCYLLFLEDLQMSYRICFSLDLSMSVLKR
jgi:alkanesulfonate monooxygenase SsuD/methylene tetrahydromethanopterin reductase-like flavin-dependent oxidoreductase (luciferase family)